MSVTISALVFLIHTVKHLWWSIDVLTFHPSHECGSHVILLSAFLWACTAHPNCARGRFIKLWVPCTCALAYTFGVVIDWRSRFSVNSACGINLHHKCIGNFFDTPTKIATKWSFSVWIYLSAMFLLCWTGGTNSQTIPFPSINAIYAAEDSCRGCASLESVLLF